MKALLNKSIALASVALVMTGCVSEDNVLEESNAKQNISFNVTADRATRAANLFSEAGEINQFYASAWVLAENETDLTAGKSYFQQDNLTKSGSTWAYDNEFGRYWPNNGETLDFYAWTNGTATDANSYISENLGGFDWNSGTPQLVKIEQKNAAAMNDILCAATPQAKHAKPNPTSEKVSINFRHALAQVGVTAKVENPKIRVQIEEVALVNLNKYGDMTFPRSSAASTGANATWAANGSADNALLTVVSDVTKDGEGQIIEYNTDAAAEPVNLTADKEDLFMVMPISGYTASVPAGITPTSVTGTCIRLSVKIWNIANASSYAGTDVQIYGKNDGYAYIYIPVAFSWESGKKYTYNLTFGKGNAGYDVNGQPTIVKVDWEPSITDWTTGSEDLNN